MKALLVIDLQVGCLGGSPPRQDLQGTLDRVNALSAAVRRSGVVIFVQHTDAAEGLEKGSAHWELSPVLWREPAVFLMEKNACDAFLETGLDEMLRQRGVTEVIIVGCATDFCVDTTVRSAAAHGYQVIVASDGHTTRDRPHLSATKIIEHHHSMWRDLLLPRQRKIRVADTATLVSELNHRELEGPRAPVGARQ
jgi:nicotinamidase-related amidase